MPRKPNPDLPDLLPDLSVREWAIFLPLIAWAFWIGIYPKPFFDVLNQPAHAIVERVNQARPAMNAR